MQFFVRACKTETQPKLGFIVDLGFNVHTQNEWKI